MYVLRLYKEDHKLMQR